jgi:hypothetical protein
VILNAGAPACPSFFLEEGFEGLLCGKAVPDSDGEMTRDVGEGGVAGAGGSTSRRDDQLHGATRDRLLHAFPGTETGAASECSPPPGCASEAGARGAAATAAVSFWDGKGMPEMSCSLRRSSVGKLSSPM